MKVIQCGDVLQPGKKMHDNFNLTLFDVETGARLGLAQQRLLELKDAAVAGGRIALELREGLPPGRYRVLFVVVPETSSRDFIEVAVDTVLADEEAEEAGASA